MLNNKKIALFLTVSLLFGCNKLKLTNINQPPSNTNQDQKRYINQNLGFSVVIPDGYTVPENKGQVVFIWPPKEDPPYFLGQHIYLAVIPKEHRQGLSILDYSNNSFDKLMSLQTGESTVLNYGEPSSMDEWETYTMIEQTTVSGIHTKVFQNTKVLGLSENTTETRYVFEKDETRYLLGYYADKSGTSTQGSVDPNIAKSVIESFKILE